MIIEQDHHILENLIQSHQQHTSFPGLGKGSFRGGKRFFVEGLKFVRFVNVGKRMDFGIATIGIATIFTNNSDESRHIF